MNDINQDLLRRVSKDIPWTNVQLVFHESNDYSLLDFETQDSVDERCG